MTHSAMPLTRHERIYVAGHRGLVGSALLRKLKEKGFSNIITRSHKDLDLLDQSAVATFFAREKPDHVFLAAARVGGILANNTYRAEFIYQNLMIQSNVIHQSFLHGVKRLLFLGSSCIYPKLCPQPMKEEHLLTGPLEPTNSPYAVAKIAGIEMCGAYNVQYGTKFLPVMPTNLYGPNDNFDLQDSHVLPALIRKFHLSKLAMNKNQEGIRRDQERFGPIPAEIRDAIGLSEDGFRLLRDHPRVVLWGTGSPRREFLHVDDMAEACIFLMENTELDSLASDGNFSGALYNIGTGRDLTIRDLAEMVQGIVGYAGDTVYDESKPDGTPRKLLDVSRMSRLGWHARIPLRDGISRVYEWYTNASRPPFP